MTLVNNQERKVADAFLLLDGDLAPGRIVPWPKCQSSRDTLEEADVGLRGITCRQFQELTGFVKRLCRTGLLQSRSGQRVRWTSITMHEVCYDVIKPVIEKVCQERCAWSTLVNQGQARKPKIFVSHSWDESYQDFVDTFHHVKLDRGLTANDVVWICTFANNQFELDLGASLATSPFHGALKYAHHVALFLDHTASALSRSWCNFELAITTDSSWNRRRWATRQELATEKGCDLFDVEWSDVEESLYRGRSSSGGQAFASEEYDEKQLLLCTPAGMVGTQRVTSGPVLKALSNHKSSKAESYSDVDRRRIMNHIAYNYLRETSNPNAELKGVRVGECGTRYLDGETKVHIDTAPCRSSGKPEYAYEHNLSVEGPFAQQFKMLDDNVFIECTKALERRGLRPSVDAIAKTRNPYDSPKLERVALRDSQNKESGLSLAQMRDLEVLLRRTCTQSNMIVDGKRLTWETCTTRHLYPSSIQQKAHIGNNKWDGLAAVFMPSTQKWESPKSVTYAECVNELPQTPEYYIIMPWGMLLIDFFKSIEWHAEAHGLSDRTTYFVQALCNLNPAPEVYDLRPGACEETMRATTEGVLMVVNESLSAQWRQNPHKQSLWCFYELWLAEQQGLAWDIACNTGISATSRPLANAKWEVGDFDPRIAEHLAHMNFRAQDTTRAHEKDRSMILAHIGSSPGGINRFNKTVTVQLSIRMLATSMRHAAYIDDGVTSFEKLECSLRLLEKHRSRYFVNLQSFRGSFGETPLHILAARHDLGGPLLEDGHAIMFALINAGFSVNDQDDEGETPLHWAAFAGAEWATSFLLRQGASPMIANYKGDRPLQVAQAKPTDFLRAYSTKLEDMLASSMIPWDC